jgi:hypothetical protein
MINEPISNPRLTLDNLTMLVCGFVILALLYIWLFTSLNIIIKITITSLLMFSMYYQVMTSRQGLSHMTIVMNIEDRIMNEVAYQVIKRGYYIRFEIKEKESAADLRKPSAKWLRYSIMEKFGDVEDNVYLAVVKCNMPKWKRKYVKFISFINVVLRPAWAYREFDEEDDIMYNENVDKDLVNVRS